MATDPPETDMQPSLGRYSVSPFLKPEVSAQIRNRDPKKRVSWNWYDTWQEEHLRAFVVAKLCKADLLQEVHKSIQQAVDTGMTFQEWNKEILPKLQHEWIGRTYGDIWVNDLHRDIEDLPETQREKLISPRRLETIYRTNMKVAHAAGQYQSLKDMADLYPYWRYCTVGDDHVREAHRALNGMVFRHDDPFWDTHYPPNGWNCRCYVRAMDEDDLEEAGLKVTDSRDLQQTGVIGEDSGRVQNAYEVNGETVSTADGWNYNPGRVDKQVDAIVDRKTAGYEPTLADQVQNDAKSCRRRWEHTRGTIDSSDEPSSISKADYIQKLKALTKNDQPKVLTEEQYLEWLSEAQALSGEYYDRKTEYKTKSTDKQTALEQKWAAELAMKKHGSQVIVGAWPKHIQRALEEKYGIKCSRHLVVDSDATLNHLLKEKASTSLSPEHAEWVLTNIHALIQKAIYSDSPYSGIFYDQEDGKHNGDIVLLIPDDNFNISTNSDKNTKQVLKIIIRPNFKKNKQTTIRTACHIQPSVIDYKFQVEKSWKKIV